MISMLEAVAAYCYAYYIIIIIIFNLFIFILQMIKLRFGDFKSPDQRHSGSPSPLCPIKATQSIIRYAHPFISPRLILRWTGETQVFHVPDFLPHSARPIRMIS